MQSQQHAAPLALLLTAPTPGAIAVVQMHHVDAKVTASLGLPALPAGAMKVFSLRDEHGIIDDCLLVCPREGVLELHLHGGVAVVRRTLALLEHHHIATAQPTAETLTATGMSKLDAQIAALLPLAETDTAVRMLAAQPALHARHAAEQSARASRPSWQNDSDDQWLRLRANLLRYFFSPPRVAIIGPPNAGKSTLANALLGRPISITSAQPGTTRDWVDASALVIAGNTHLKITLVDTAGIRATHDPIEREAISRSHDQARAADVVILVADASTPPTRADMNQLARLITQVRRPILALNKCDLPTANETPWQQLGLPIVRLSALHHQNLAGLSEAILEALDLLGDVTKEMCIIED